MSQRNGTIRLSEEHGVNPTLLCCPLCGIDTGVALIGKLPGDEQAPRRSSDVGPCDECSDLMKQGFLFVEVDGDHYTGNKWVVRSEVISDPAMRQAGAAFIAPEQAREIGLYNHPDFKESNDETSD